MHFTYENLLFLQTSIACILKTGVGYAKRVEKSLWRACVCVCSVELAGTGQRKSRFSKQKSNKVPNASGYLIEVWQGENRLLRGSEGLIASIRGSNHTSNGDAQLKIHRLQRL